VQSQENLKAMLDELADKKTKGKEEEPNSNTSNNNNDEPQKMSLFYRMAMDNAAIEEAGDKPMVSLLELCRQISNSTTTTDWERATKLGTMVLKFGFSPFFSIGTSPDNKDSEHEAYHPHISGGTDHILVIYGNSRRRNSIRRPFIQHV
jgi:predicted metalloendopeptidase